MKRHLVYRERITEALHALGGTERATLDKALGALVETGEPPGGRLARPFRSARFGEVSVLEVVPGWFLQYRLADAVPPLFGPSVLVYALTHLSLLPAVDVEVGAREAVG